MGAGADAEKGIRPRHPCRKVRVVCEIRTPQDTVLSAGENTCLSSIRDGCARERMEMGRGEGYKYCGPPVHAEIEAVKWLPPGVRVAGLRAHIFGSNGVHYDNQAALLSAGIRTWVIHDGRQGP